MGFSVAAIKQAQKRRAQAAPSLPPLGSFDPSILLQYGANKRAASDAQDIFSLSKTQAEDQYGINKGRLDTNTGQSLQDLATQHSQTLADLLTGRQRNTQDYQRATADLAHNYSILADKQNQGARQANVESAGILGHAADIRAANQSHDQQGLDTPYQRALADSTTAEQRTNAAYDTNVQRTNQNAGWQGSDLALALARRFGSGTGGNPLGTDTLNLLQTMNNATSGNLDLSGVAYQQAAANGFRFPTRRKRTVIV